MPQSTIEYTLYFTHSTQHSGYKVLCLYLVNIVKFNKISTFFGGGYSSFSIH